MEFPKGMTYKESSQSFRAA